ncbi:DUF4252 domain-containing protein [Flavobacterium sp. NRK1]|uniref:DUF4252 domain-containing protein n=1 Tax=Flavobacterium sp. NRK1 TaxID=2954929 RepID=UPI002092308D|nr:DUF4252 domain-containing protein [Flavobacterium sp. NRK1]MCO6148557.1 DUF4252 domain-containing protein [Flavobacterium sp. NRK1]
MKSHLYMFAALVLLLTSCDRKLTLQKYFVEKGEAKNFSVVDIAPSFMKTDKLDLNEDQKKALDAMHKLNVLIFKSDKNNGKAYDTEKATIKEVLKSDHYDELMKMNFGDGGLSVNTKGEGENIEEFVLFLHNKESGLGVVRVLGDDMTPQDVMTIVGLLQQTKTGNGQFQQLLNIMKKN